MKRIDHIYIDGMSAPGKYHAQEEGTHESDSRHGIDMENLDPTVSPKDDFYLYACGGWMKRNPLTPEFSRFGTFDRLRENARVQLKQLITGLADDPESKVRGSNAQKVSDLYAMGMDSERLNREGAAPVMPFVDRIETSPREELFRLLGWMHNGLTGSFFSTGVGPDPKGSDTNIMHIGEVGLGLGDRDYYLEKNESNDRILHAYEKYVKRLMELIGYDPETQERVWGNVISLETEFARHKMTREERRDPLARYNMRDFDRLLNDYPHIDWKTYFSTLGVEKFAQANVGSPRFMEFIDSYLPSLTDRQIKDYLIYDVVSDSSGVLSEDFQDANFEMFGKVMSGKEEPEPRWKRAMTIPNSMLGEAVGELYVKKYFPDSNKTYMLKLVENLRKALGKHIDALPWMSDATKMHAHEKLAALTVKIGYPDKWKDYSGIEIDPAKSYLENVYQASIWYTQDNYKKLGKPVDKQEWHMTPQTVNAYYSPSVNEICFPAGILQPPYFDLTASDAQNYGAIGVVIGHEMTHGFDDQGRHFDMHGNLVDWWLPEDSERFTKLADRLETQFNEVEVAPGVFANGKFTLGENIADQGGLRIALTAFLDSRDSVQTDEIGGFSALQRFYLAYAGVWAGNIRPEEILVRTKTDPHSLGRNRVNVTLRNITPFMDAFGISEGDRMYRPADQRVVVW